MSILPQDWHYSNYKKEFGISRRLYDDVKHFQQFGELPVRKVRSDKKDEALIEIIEEFYRSAGISRQVHGVKNFINVIDADGKSVPRQKYVLLHSIEEAFELFKEENPNLCKLTFFYNHRYKTFILILNILSWKDKHWIAVCGGLDLSYIYL